MSKALRNMSAASRVWLAAHELCPPFLIQMIFEGRGVLDVNRWQKAVAAASEANPGSRAVLKGHLCASRWIDSGTAPPVRVADGSRWDGMGSAGSEFLNTISSARKGPLAEVVLIHGNPLRVAFCAHHAIMDGRGCITWAENIFRALRGEPVRFSDDTLVEDDLLNHAQSKPTGSPCRRFIAPTGFARESDTGVLWVRRKISGHFPRILPQVLLLMAREVWRHHCTSIVRIGVPVDLRHRRPGLRSTGNLSNAIFIDITPGDTPSSLAYEILRRLKRRQDGTPTWEEKLIHLLPLWLLKRMLGKESRQAHLKGLYRFSGLVSNLGSLNLEAFQGGGFTSRSCLIVPACLESFPFSMTMIGTGHENSLVLSMPKALSSGGRLEETLERVAKGLKQSGEDINRSREVLNGRAG